jgi:hypothetical protein
MGDEAQDVAVEGERGIEIGHGDADMGDAGAVGHLIPPTE